MRKSILHLTFLCCLFTFCSQAQSFLEAQTTYQKQEVTSTTDQAPMIIGDTPSPKAQKYLDQTREARAAYVLENAHRFKDAYSKRAKSSSNVTWIPIQAHFVGDGQYAYGFDFFGYTYLLKDLNALLLPAGIQLYNCDKIKYINNNPNLYNFNYPAEASTLDPYDVSGVINFYFVKDLIYNGSSACGYASQPGDPKDRIMITTFCLGYDKETVASYLAGLYFSLYPTHRNSTGSGYSDELVDRLNNPNCATAGDELCDTPADPGFYRSGAYDRNTCSYVGNFLDANQDGYVPMEDNIMSLAGDACRSQFTPMQIARMQYSIQNDRTHLNCSKPAPCAFKVNSYPRVYTFENGFQGWDNVPFYQSVLYGDFLVNTGTTPTPNTGPSNAFEGQKYIYAEADIQPLDADEAPFGYPNAIIESPCFDFSALNAPQITYNYHMWGADINELNFQISTDGGYTWTAGLGSHVGDQGNNWQSNTVDLSAYGGMDCIRFRFVAGFTSVTANEADIALDGIRVEDANPCIFDVDATVMPISCFGEEDGSIALSFPAPGQQPYTIEWSTGDIGFTTLNNLESATYTATITDANNCWDVIEEFVPEPAELSVNLEAFASSGNSDGTINLTVTGGTSPYAYTWSNGATTQNIQNLDEGNYQVTITDLSGCTVEKSVFLSEFEACTGTKSGGWPYTNGLEGGTGLFKQNQDDDTNWRKRSGATPTPSTGPNVAAEGSYYRHIEASGNRHPDKTAVLTTRRCLNLSNVANPVFRFQYHMYGNQMGSLEVQLSQDGGLTWGASIWGETGDQGNVWKTAEIDLSSYILNSLRIRIVGTTGNGPRSDMAIDDLYIGSAASQIPIVNFPSTISITLTRDTEALQLFPNPAQTNVTLRLNLQAEQTYSLEIINNVGQRIKKMSVDDTTNYLNLEIQDLPNGLYQIILINLTTGKMDREALIVSQ
ncbi:MAG: T9SS type A sorting domain-containing protein [Bacteroidota bacterium]